MTPIHQQRIREALHSVSKIQPQELAPVLASFYMCHTFAVACQQLQQLADILSHLSVAVGSFVMDAHWQRQVDGDMEKERQAQRVATGPKGEPMLSVAQAAAKLGVTKPKVYEMVKCLKLPAVNINEGMGKKPLIRICASDLP